MKVEHNIRDVMVIYLLTQRQNHIVEFYFELTPFLHYM